MLADPRVGYIVPSGVCPADAALLRPPGSLKVVATSGFFPFLLIYPDAMIWATRVNVHTARESPYG